MPITEETLDKVVTEIRVMSEQALDQVKGMAEDKCEMIRAQAQEKQQDLQRQNDGLLAAVGRLQAERYQLERRLEQEEQRHREFQIRTEQQAKDVERVALNLQEDRDRQAVEYKRRIADLEAKLKKQGKK